jgi:hypothetical protein
MRKQLKPGVALVPSLDSAKNKIDVIEVDALTASYTVYHREALDFQIAREFLPSRCFRIPLDIRCESGDKVLFMYEGNRYFPITQFFNQGSKLSEQSPLFSHWRSRIAAAFCDIAMYGSRYLAAPLTAKNISVSSDGDAIAIVDAEWGAEKDLDCREEELAVPSLVHIMNELIDEKIQGPVLKCILEIASEGGCTIFDLVRHQYFRSFQPLADIRNQMKHFRASEDGGEGETGGNS